MYDNKIRIFNSILKRNQSNKKLCLNNDHTGLNISCNYASRVD